MEHTSLNVVDLAVIGTILISGLLALMRGFVREVLSLAAWVGAGLAAVYFYPYLKPWMHKHIESEQICDIVTTITIFCVALAILIPLGIFAADFIRGRALTAIDRSLGFIFGVARGMLVVCLLFMLTLWVWPEKEKEPPELAEARTRPLLASGSEMLKTLLPKGDQKKLSEGARALMHDNKAPPIDTSAPASNTTTARTPELPPPSASPTVPVINTPSMSPENNSGSRP